MRIFKTTNNLKSSFKVLIASIILLIAVGCSKLQTDIPSAPAVTTHKSGITIPDSINFHGNLVRSNGWNMNTCIQCHASDYSGGIAEASCLNCHTNTGGPEACNTCHGDFNDITRIAPPRDINKNNVTDSAGVGAHVKHLYDNQLGSMILCSTCHQVPQEVYYMGHVDSYLPAEVIFGNLANHNIATNPVYNFESASCSDVYCHGNWEFLRDSSSNPWIYTDSIMVGNAYAPKWNKVDGTEAVCGSCHLLPPTGHQNAGNDPNATTCASCHPGVVDVNGNIIDQTKHINGMKNVVF